jgi:membrane-bound serine protease (ClpP class)
MVLTMLLRARRQPVVSGNATLIGASGRVTRWRGTQGQVLVQGEYWNARATRALATGDLVRVTGREGLHLIVEAV